jgi:hypothetical protein
MDFMERNPLLGNAIQAAVINATGVIISSFLKGEAINWKMVLIFMIIGAFVVTPLVLNILIGRVFQLGLNKWQTFVASTLFGVFVIGGAFEISFPVLLKAFDPEDDICMKPIIMKLFTREFLKGNLESRYVFTPADLLNTFVVPPMFQPLVSNVAGLIWTVVLAMRAPA